MGEHIANPVVPIPPSPCRDESLPRRGPEFVLHSLEQRFPVLRVGDATRAKRCSALERKSREQLTSLPARKRLSFIIIKVIPMYIGNPGVIYGERVCITLHYIFPETLRYLPRI